VEFLDKKEEVYEFQLTEYGKHLHSIGKLKPEYYAFFDDDILYDTSGSGYTENQNMTRVRIQEDTPALKATVTRTSAETRVTQFINNLEGPIGSSNSDPANRTAYFRQPVFEDKGKINAYALGRSSLNTQYNPSWKATILSKAEISSSQDHINTSDYIEHIPQLNITLDYYTYFKSGDLSDNSITAHLKSSAGDETGIFLALNEDYLLLEILEENTDFEKENFDIEIYHSSSAPIGTGSFVQLAYTPESKNHFVFPREINNSLNAPGNVEYYFNVLVDKEIPYEVIEELNISEKALSTNASRLKLNRDLYTTSTTSTTSGPSAGSNDEEPC
jgi:hypothetical protein